MGGGGDGVEECFVQHFFFSLASVSFYCKDCAGIFFLKSSTPPPSIVKWTAPYLLLVLLSLKNILITTNYLKLHI